MSTINKTMVALYVADILPPKDRSKVEQAFREDPQVQAWFMELDALPDTVLNGNDPAIATAVSEVRASMDDRWPPPRPIPWLRILQAAAVLFVIGLATYGVHADRDHRETQQFLEAKFDLQVKISAGLLQAGQRLNNLTFDRKRRTFELLKSTAELCNKLDQEMIKRNIDVKVREEIVEKHRQDIRSMYAAALATLDFENTEWTKFEREHVSSFRHWTVAIRPDGKYMVVGRPKLGAQPERPVAWKRGEKFTLPSGLDPRDERPSLWYSPDGKFVVFAPITGGLELWDSTAESMLKEWKPEPRPRILAVGFVGNMLWAFQADGLMQPLLLSTLKETDETKKWKVDGVVPFTAASFSADGSLLAVGDKNGRVRLLTSDGKPLDELSPGKGEAESKVEAIAWSSDKASIAVGTRDGTLRLWKIGREVPVHRFRVSGHGVGGISFSPNGRWLVAGVRNLSGTVWDTETGDQVLTANGVPGGFSADGKYLALGSINAVAFAELNEPKGIERIFAGSADVVQVVWSRDCKHLVTVDSAFVIRVFQIGKNEPLDTFALPESEYFASNVGLSISDDGKLVAAASGGKSSKVLIRDVTAKKDLTNWKPLPPGFERIAFVGGEFLLVREEFLRPDAKRLQTVVYKLDPEKKDPVKMHVLRAGNEGESGFRANRITEKIGRYLWYGPRTPADSQRYEVWDAATGELVRRIPASNKSSEFGGGQQLSSDGRFLWAATAKKDVERKDPNNDGRQLEEVRVYDLADVTKASVPVSEVVQAASSKEARWLVYVRSPEHGRSILLCERKGDDWRGKPWINLAVDGQGFQSLAITFSPDNRYLTWVSRSGLMVADLDVLKKSIDEFEKGAKAPK